LNVLFNQPEDLLPSPLLLWQSHVKRILIIILIPLIVIWPCHYQLHLPLPLDLHFATAFASSSTVPPSRSMANCCDHKILKSSANCGAQAMLIDQGDKAGDVLSLKDSYATLLCHCHYPLVPYSSQAQLHLDPCSYQSFACGRRSGGQAARLADNNVNKYE
jgi:hypothetical protein